MQTPLTLTALLACAIEARPSGPGVTDAEGTLDWPAFARRVDGFAACLMGAGATAGSRVALWLPNSADYLALIFACGRLGATAVHINTRFRSTEVAYLLRRARPTVLVTEWGFAPVDFPAIFSSLAPEDRSTLHHVIGRHLPGDVARVAELPASPLIAEGSVRDAATPEAACLTYTTSGTTSGPKLVLHNQRTIATHAADVMRHLRLDTPGATLLAAVPFCGTFGNAAAMAAVAAGAHVVCMERFDASEADQLIREHAVTHMVGGDDMMARLAEAAAGRPHTTVRFFGFAAFHPNPGAAIEAAIDAGLNPHGLYGSSEVQALFSAAMDEHRLRPGGQPSCPAAEISIRDPQTGEILPDGTSGEICIRAPSRFLGYLDDDAATERATTPDGFFRTGDLGHLAGRGFVFEARLGDTLRLGGFLVNPEEIEGFMQKLPGVAAAQVVAAEHNGAWVPVAFVRPRSGHTIDGAAILEECRAKLARYKVPKLIEMVEAFPTTDSPNGVKIQRVKLREMAAALLKDIAA
jgi:fatty-acyl-CoA synthase